jgi:hypothetical protein
MKLERINQLFEEGLITSEEHQSLVKQFCSNYKKTSRFVWASLITASIGWLIMLSYTVNGSERALLSSENRGFAGAIFGFQSLIFYYIAKLEIKNSLDVGGLEIAARGQALSIAILLIVVPVLLLSLFYR